MSIYLGVDFLLFDLMPLLIVEMDDQKNHCLTWNWLSVVLVSVTQQIFDVWVIEKHVVVDLVLGLAFVLSNLSIAMCFCRLLVLWLFLIWPFQQCSLHNLNRLKNYCTNPQLLMDQPDDTTKKLKEWLHYCKYLFLVLHMRLDKFLLHNNLNLDFFNFNFNIFLFFQNFNWIGLDWFGLDWFGFFFTK